MDIEIALDQENEDDIGINEDKRYIYFYFKNIPTITLEDLAITFYFQNAKPLDRFLNKDKLKVKLDTGYLALDRVFNNYGIVSEILLRFKGSDHNTYFRRYQVDPDIAYYLTFP
jgi:hypothetical protein